MGTIVVGSEPTTTDEVPPQLQQRQIGFRCVDSFFFSEFDGTWLVSEESKGTKLKYVVDVRPKGPVPVAALEWRIREDVPTNLRAVKKAALTVGAEGVRKYKQSRQALRQSVQRAYQRAVGGWQENETMAAYLK